MPSDPPFVSFGGNAEDVVLLRALGEVTEGRYVEIGAASPSTPSITRAFYDRGWSGLALVPDAGVAERFRQERPRDSIVLTDGSRSLDAVLDEAPRPGGDLHVLVVRAGGSGDAVPTDAVLGRWRPWVLVIGADPSSPAVLSDSDESLIRDAGYEFCLFDGVSRFYVSAEHAEQLRGPLGVPANVLDGFVPYRWSALEQALAASRTEVERWRGEVLARWSGAVGAPVDPTAGRGSHEIVRLKTELAAMQSTVSWRVTAPLRVLQQRRLRQWR